MGNCLGRCLAGKSNLRRATDDQAEELVQEEESIRENFAFKIMKFKKKKRTQFLDNFWDNPDLSYSRLKHTNQADTAGIQLQCLDAQTLLITARETLNNKYTAFRPESVIASSSRASSSLDLEWEHEYSGNQERYQSWLALPEEVSIRCYEDDGDSLRTSNHSLVNLCIDSKTINKNGGFALAPRDVTRFYHRTPSRTSWSHISTPESLEWDVDEEQQNQLTVEDDSLDHETLALLHEIEMLKKKVLNETGEGLETGGLPPSVADS